MENKISQEFYGCNFDSVNMTAIRIRRVQDKVQLKREKMISDLLKTYDFKKEYIDSIDFHDFFYYIANKKLIKAIKFMKEITCNTYFAFEICKKMK